MPAPPSGGGGGGSATVRRPSARTGAAGTSKRSEGAAAEGSQSRQAAAPRPHAGGCGSGGVGEVAGAPGSSSACSLQQGYFGNVTVDMLEVEGANVGAEEAVEEVEELLDFEVGEEAEAQEPRGRMRAEGRAAASDASEVDDDVQEVDEALEDEWEKVVVPTGGPAAAGGWDRDGAGVDACPAGTQQLSEGNELAYEDEQDKVRLEHGLQQGAPQEAYASVPPCHDRNETARITLDECGGQDRSGVTAVDCRADGDDVGGADGDQREWARGREHVRVADAPVTAPALSDSEREEVEEVAAGGQVRCQVQGKEDGAGVWHPSHEQQGDGEDDEASRQVRLDDRWKEELTSDTRHRLSELEALAFADSDVDDDDDDALPACSLPPHRALNSHDEGDETGQHQEGHAHLECGAGESRASSSISKPVASAAAAHIGNVQGGGADAGAQGHPDAVDHVPAVDAVVGAGAASGGSRCGHEEQHGSAYQAATSRGQQGGGAGAAGAAGAPRSLTAAGSGAAASASRPCSSASGLAAQGSAAGETDGSDRMDRQASAAGSPAQGGARPPSVSSSAKPAPLHPYFSNFKNLEQAFTWFDGKGQDEARLAELANRVIKDWQALQETYARWENAGEEHEGNAEDSQALKAALRRAGEPSVCCFRQLACLLHCAVSTRAHVACVCA